MKKVFFVCDSYHTSSIVEAIQEAFPEAIIYMDSTVTSSDGGSPFLGMINGLTKSETEHEIKKDKIETKIDYFVLSAKLILDGSINPEELKKNYGSEKAVTVAVSTMSVFLDSVSACVDHTAKKDKFTYDEEYIKEYFKELSA